LTSFLPAAGLHVEIRQIVRRASAWVKHLSAL
jgi:hypothetical protein